MPAQGAVAEREAWVECRAKVVRVDRVSQSKVTAQLPVPGERGQQVLRVGLVEPAVQEPEEREVLLSV